MILYNNMMSSDILYLVHAGQMALHLCLEPLASERLLKRLLERDQHLVEVAALGVHRGDTHVT